MDFAQYFPGPFFPFHVHSMPTPIFSSDSLRLSGSSSQIAPLTRILADTHSDNRCFDHLPGGPWSDLTRGQNKQLTGRPSTQTRRRGASLAADRGWHDSIVFPTASAYPCPACYVAMSLGLASLVPVHNPHSTFVCTGIVSPMTRRSSTSPIHLTSPDSLRHFMDFPYPLSSRSKTTTICPSTCTQGLQQVVINYSWLW